MNMKEKRLLEKGDEIYWIDPDNNNASGHYTIIEILTESGMIEDETDVITITNDAGSVTEIYVSEIQ